MRVLKAGKELQDYKTENTPTYCPLCERPMQSIETRNRVVDHDHKTGMVRGVLCRNCNGIEGKIYNLCIRAGKFIGNERFLLNVIEYWRIHRANPTGVYYPGTKIQNGRAVPPKKKRRKRK